MTENRDDVRKYPLLSHMAGLWSEPGSLHPTRPKREKNLWRGIRGGGSHSAQIQ